MLASKERRREVVTRMVVVTQNLPGTLGEKMAMRGDLERMVDQLEADITDPNGCKGRLPTLFATFTCAIYKWSQLHDLLEKMLPAAELEGRCPRQDLSETALRQRFYRDAAAHPGLVSWACAVRLEQMVHLAVRVITHQLRGYRFEPAEWLPESLGEEHEAHSTSPSRAAAPTHEKDPSVDDWYASFEWGAGGIVHIHLVLWVHGAPRIDVALEPNEDGRLPQTDATAGDVVVLSEDVASIMSSFFDCIYAEYNTKKHHDGSQAPALGEKEHHRHDGMEKGVADPCSIAWSQLRDMLEPHNDTTTEDPRTLHMKQQKISTSIIQHLTSGCGGTVQHLAARLEHTAISVSRVRSFRFQDLASGCGV